MTRFFFEIKLQYNLRINLLFLYVQIRKYGYEINFKA